MRECQYVGIGYHSPNMEVTRQRGQHRDAEDATELTDGAARAGGVTWAAWAVAWAAW